MKLPSIKNGLVVDASALIDLYVGARRALPLISANIGQLHVPTPILSEVEHLDERRCRRLGLSVYQPSVQQLTIASRRIAGLSFADRICLTVACEERWVVVTNDKPLRKQCVEANVLVAWGLELLVDLVGRKVIPKDDAVAMGKAIQETNPYITAGILDRYVKKCAGATRENLLVPTLLRESS